MISGWISSPSFARKTSRGIYVYVNGRYVRDKIIQHALFEGYAQRLMKGQFPVAVLFITVPYDQVDVNVHPTKSEVRFAEHRNVHDSVKRIVTQTLNRGDRPQWASGYKAGIEQLRPTTRVSEEGVQDAGFGVQGLQNTAQGSRLKAESTAKDQQFRTLNAEPGTRSEQTAIWQKAQFGDLKILGQIHDTYILCEAEDGLILIDQHAAHERVLFEQLQRRSKDLVGASQKLLVPETLELGYRESHILEKLIAGFNDLGLEIEPFGGNTFVVKSVPALLAGREVKPLIIETLEKMAAIGFSPQFEQSLDECLKVMACHGAIRANQALSDPQIKELLDQLDQSDNPSHCPHGRPTWVQWTLESLEKSFKRRV
jgi:DNA mismatch repair protein MutL